MWLFFEGRPQRMLLALLAIILVLVGVVGFVNATPETEAPAKEYNPQTKVMAEFLLMTNALRRNYGLTEVRASQLLEKSANAKLNDMQQNGYWGHYGPKKASFSDFIWQEKSDSTKAGENLARCFNNHDDAFKALVSSPTHFKVLTTADFDELGVASSINDKGCESIVMHFSN